jgi:D-alanyl-D-alanine carboxypeptidase/D-alanyl-D-alanine-endopeptidase (penicillin-binding protein 4)
MNTIIRLSLIRPTLAALALAPMATALARDLPAPVEQAMKKAELPAASLGVYVQAVDAKRPLLAVNAERAFSPASTMKLVTTYAALELLGPTYTWKTQAYAAGPQTGDILNGDLVIKGSGDPKLVTENFWLFLRQIRARGIREIRGNLVLDRSAFEDVQYDPTRFDGDASKPYNVGSDALLLNYSALRFRFVPNATLNSVSVSVDPPMTGFTVSGPKLANDDCGDWQKKLGAALSSSAVFAGSFSTACGEKTWYAYPYQMTSNQYFGAVFRQMWADLGGNLKGEVKSGTTPPGAVMIAEWESPTLPEVIRDINKYSNNVMARQTLLTLAWETQHQPANAARGAQAIRDWLAAKEIDASELVIDNGSGLSRTERIAPHSMGRLLVDAFRSPLMPEFISSMPLVGYDGTMRKRLREKSVAGRAHIKTGRLDDVRAIAGFVQAASGKYFVVVSMINHRNADNGVGVHDALLQWLYEHG